MYLKQATAVTVAMGPFVDDTDGKTAETALTIAQADVRLSKNGAAFAQKSDAAACTHLENGHYACSLNGTDTGTLGHLRVAIAESGALPVWRDFLVLPANVYDSLLGSDRLQVHAAEISDGLITAATLATGAIDADALAADAVAEMADGLWDEVLESTLTGRQFMRIFMAALAGKSTGGGTSTIAFRDLADTKDRLSATVDVNRNRTAVAKDGT